jgi:serine/threonine protein phosphatase 1
MIDFLSKVSYPVVAVGDIHGRLDLLEAMLPVLDREVPNHTIVFLGDFVDRGPHTKECVELVLNLVKRGQATAVMGNHDLALVRAAGLDGNPPSQWWADRYIDCYDCEPTFASYMGHGNLKRWGYSLTGLAASMPVEHREFLAGLPWVVSAGAVNAPHGHIFIHSGLSRGLEAGAFEQLADAHKKRWDATTATPQARFSPNSEYPPWLGADRSAAANPLPLPGWIQVSGHDYVRVPTVTVCPQSRSPVGIRIDTSAGFGSCLTACVLDGPTDDWRILSVRGEKLR